MTKSRTISLVVAVAVLVAGSYGIRAITAPAEAAPRPVSAVDNPSRSSLNEVDRLIGVYEGRIANRETATEYALLGDLYLQRGQLTRDLAAYAAATDVFTRLRTIDPAGIEGKLGLASASLALHDFPTAGNLAADVLEQEPAHPTARTIAADVALAVGDFDAAGFHIEELLALDPGHPAVAVRRAALAKDTGDLERAIEFAIAAVEASPGSGYAPGFYLTFLASVSSDAGFHSDAVVHARAAVKADPSPGAFAELGRALGAIGDIEAAIEAYENAIALLPDPAYLAALGDLYMLSGDESAAARQYDTVRVIAALDDTGAYSRAIGYFYADHDLEPALALDLAENGLEVRDDAGAHDLYAWALYRNGRHAEARDAIDVAIAINPSSSRYWFHAALISEALGDGAVAVTEASTALALNPAFDPLQARDARALIERLSS